MRSIFTIFRGYNQGDGNGIADCTKEERRMEITPFTVYTPQADLADLRDRPAWYRNLVEHPDIAVQVGPDTFAARAHTATTEEKPARWRQIAAIFPLYECCQATTARDIPVGIVERVP